MRVAVLSHTYVEPVNRKKLRAIAEQGVELTLLAPAAWREAALGREWRTEPESDGGLRVVPVGVRRLLATPAAAVWDAHDLAATLSSGPYDLLHVEEEPWSLAARAAVRQARRFRLPTVLFTWHNLPGYPPWPLRLLARRVLGRYDGWVAGNAAAAQLLRRVDAARPLVILPQLGVDPPPGEMPRRDPTAATHIGFVGRLVPEKGVADLLDALARVTAPSRLTIVGDGPERAALASRAASLGLADRVTFRGAVAHHEVAALMRTLDILVLPSRGTARWAEQFGHVLLEAMAAGAVAVGSDCGAIPEVIDDAGIVFPQGDVDGLATALDDLARDGDERARLQRAGRARAAQFTHAALAERLVGFWRTVLEARDA
jgi:glycosyltransferase involved in cell wall biosynthesis